MPKEKEKSENKAVEKQIKAAERKIKFFFKNLPPEKMKFILEPIHQLAVTQVLLNRLSEEIQNGDVIEWFCQGKQKIRRENPAIKAYNTTIKSYTALFKTMLDLLPEQAAEKAGEALLSFVHQTVQAKK